MAKNAIHLEGSNHYSLGTPLVPFKVISLDEAIKGDAPTWLEAIKAELNLLK